MRKNKKNTSRTCCSFFRRKDESCRKNREGKHKEQDEVHVVCVRAWFFAKSLLGGCKNDIRVTILTRKKADLVVGEVN